MQEVLLTKHVLGMQIIRSESPVSNEPYLAKSVRLFWPAKILTTFFRRRKAVLVHNVNWTELNWTRMKHLPLMSANWVMWCAHSIIIERRRFPVTPFALFHSISGPGGLLYLAQGQGNTDRFLHVKFTNYNFDKRVFLKVSCWSKRIIRPIVFISLES